ncbi:MAG: hypothetical protein O7C63_01170 [Alphaproteobacteria bacterium]|nr:hypothetical protein [Alphaproteobacteria bacterium]
MFAKTVSTRRAMLIASSGLLFPAFVSSAAQALLAPSPRAAEGPFYPVTELTDRDSDLIKDAAAIESLGGQILALTGTLRDVNERAIVGATIEIWQCDPTGIYLHPRDRNFARFAKGFQGLGAALSDGGGRFGFRTIVPVPYPGRTPHIHLKVFVDGRARLTTQYYVRGHPLNARDGLFSRLGDDEKQLVQMDVLPNSGSDADWRADIDVVIAT